MCRSFALLYHLPFIAYFGLDLINSQNAASVMYASIFLPLVAPFTMDVGHYPFRAGIEPVFS